MQSLEAVISLMVLVFILSYMLSGIAEEPGIDDSLYRYQLAGDVWRVVSLRGNLEDFDFEKGNDARDKVEEDFEEIERITGLCTYMGGIRVTSCPGEKATVRIASINRLVYTGGFLNRSATNATLMIAKPKKKN